MTSFDRFERSLPALFDELATPRVPDYYDDVMTRTAATRQRPRWTFPERWLLMSALTRRFAVAPRIPWRLGALVALLAIAAVLAAIAAGALKSRPAPYGPARNGQIVFVDDQKRVVIGDPGSGTTRVVVGKPGEYTDPMFSQDGTRVAYFEDLGAGKTNIYVTAVDTSSPVLLNPKPLVAPTFGGWSALGDAFLVVSGAGEILLYDVTKTAEPRNLSRALKLGPVSIGLGYNFRSDAAFRPPSGNELVFAVQQGSKLYASPLDGGAPRLLVDGAAAGLRSISGAQWSPDGSTVLFLATPIVGPDRPHTYLVGADGTDLRPLSTLTSNPLSTQNSPTWSPDGTRIAFQQWTANIDEDLGQENFPIAIYDVAAGTITHVGPVMKNGYISWAWSPDGTSILEVPGDETNGSLCGASGCAPVKGGQILVVDARTGKWTTAPWTVDQAISWQRVAR